MTPVANFINDLTTAHGQNQLTDLKQYTDRIAGWSHPGHFFFFRSLLRCYDIKSMLVCGVYRGLDLALISHVLWHEFRGRDMNLVGVDLFEDKPCADWPEMAKGKTWEEAGMGLPPSMDEAKKNAPLAKIHKGNSIDFLKASQPEEYEFIYLDTAHDYDTVCAEIRAAREKNPKCLLAGDDYSGPGHWGVKRACDELLPHHIPIFNRIWFDF